jgi:hypothetical protein
MKRVAYHCDAPGCTSQVQVLPRENLGYVTMPPGWLFINAAFVTGAGHGQRTNDEVCSIQCAVRRVAQLLAAMENLNDAPPDEAAA